MSACVSASTPASHRTPPSRAVSSASCSKARSAEKRISCACERSTTTQAGAGRDEALRLGDERRHGRVVQVAAHLEHHGLRRLARGDRHQPAVRGPQQPQAWRAGVGEVDHEARPRPEQHRPLERQHQRRHERQQQQQARFRGRAPQPAHRVAVDHAPGGGEQHAGQARLRDVADEAAGEEQDRQREERGRGRGEARAGAARPQQRRAGQARRGREAGAERRRHVRPALGRDLALHVRARAARPRGDGELERAEQHDRRGGHQQPLHAARGRARARRRAASPWERGRAPPRAAGPWPGPGRRRPPPRCT